MTDLLALRERPSGWPILHQRWSNLLFLHWACVREDVRPRVPAFLELDLFEGSAWLSVVVFEVSRMRPTLLPPIPLLSNANQINVRTYVHRDGVPGLWFFSLDADNPPSVWGARFAYGLPYRHARITLTERVGDVSSHAIRADPVHPARFEAEWRIGVARPSPQRGTIDSFLLDRYLLYSHRRDRWLSARIHHRPWPLREATLKHLTSTMLEAETLPSPKQSPLVHASTGPLDVDIWAPTDVN